MIPEFVSKFNGSLLFDDHEVRVRATLGQDAMPTLEGGRHLLLVCPVCKRPWYKAGRSEYVRLTMGQFSRLCTAFHTDGTLLHLFPRMLCSLCSTLHLGGIFTIEEYRLEQTLQCCGYRFLWESASPPYTSLLATIYHPASVPLRTMVQARPDVLISSMRTVIDVLAWLEACRRPPAVRVYTAEECCLLTRCLPLQRSTGQGCAPSLWHGYAWKEPCAPLAETALVSLAVGPQPLEAAPFEPLLQSWRVLARVLRAVL